MFLIAPIRKQVEHIARMLKPHNKRVTLKELREVALMAVMQEHEQTFANAIKDLPRDELEAMFRYSLEELGGIRGRYFRTSVNEIDRLEDLMYGCYRVFTRFPFTTAGILLRKRLLYVKAIEITMGHLTSKFKSKCSCICKIK
jgi:hypothetical protein